MGFNIGGKVYVVNKVSNKVSNKIKKVDFKKEVRKNG